MGVETNELLKWTPWSRIMRKVFGMTSMEPAMFQTSNRLLINSKVYGSSKDTSTQGVSGLGGNDLPPFIMHQVIHRYTVSVAQYRHRSWLLILWPISNSNGFRLPN